MLMRWWEPPNTAAGKSDERPAWRYSEGDRRPYYSLKKPSLKQKSAAIFGRVGTYTRGGVKIPFTRGVVCNFYLQDLAL